MKWIPVDERWPPVMPKGEEVGVLVYAPGGFECSFDVQVVNSVWARRHAKSGFISHWCIPEPPEAKP